MAVIGPNGSGKSTLLSAIAGLNQNLTGTIDAGGATVALVLQSTEVDRSIPLTVIETVRMGTYANVGFFGRMTAEDSEAVTAAMARMDIEDLASKQIHELSGGQRQRVLVAQGLAQRADILLLDEPMNSLDVSSRQLIVDAIEQQRSEGRIVVMTTHDLDDARGCDQVLLVSKRAIAFGTPDEVIAEDNLREAFGGKVLRLPGGELLMDDPHHHH